MTTPADPRADGAEPPAMTLAEQVADAQREVASWSEEKRRSVQLEGEDLRKTPEQLATSARLTQEQRSELKLLALEYAEAMFAMAGSDFTSRRYYVQDMQETRTALHTYIDGL